mgnify:CR=1 FL=1
MTFDSATPAAAAPAMGAPRRTSAAFMLSHPAHAIGVHSIQRVFEGIGDIEAVAPNDKHHDHDRGVKQDAPDRDHG